MRVPISGEVRTPVIEQLIAGTELYFKDANKLCGMSMKQNIAK